jgi:hypothetical protein
VQEPLLVKAWAAPSRPRAARWATVRERTRQHIDRPIVCAGNNHKKCSAVYREWPMVKTIVMAGSHTCSVTRRTRGSAPCGERAQASGGPVLLAVDLELDVALDDHDELVRVVHV